MKNIAIIPARGCSKRLPNKNILLLDGIPLIAHSIIYAQEHSTIIDDIYITTDDQEIKEIAIKFGAKVIDRPLELSGDFEPTVSALKHALNVINQTIESVFLLQPTNPLRPENLVQQAYEVYKTNNSSSLFTVTRNHQKFGKIIGNKFIPFNYEIGQRSQDLEPIYFENGLLYITKAQSILEDRIITEDAFPFEVNHFFSTVDIDSQDDFDYAEYLLNKSKKTNL
jgi:N-acylneuraminate cytidylyltransferase